MISELHSSRICRSRPFVHAYLFNRDLCWVLMYYTISVGSGHFLPARPYYLAIFAAVIIRQHMDLQSDNVMAGKNKITKRGKNGKKGNMMDIWHERVQRRPAIASGPFSHLFLEPFFFSSCSLSPIVRFLVCDVSTRVLPARLTSPFLVLPLMCIRAMFYFPGSFIFCHLSPVSSPLFFYLDQHHSTPSLLFKHLPATVMGEVSPLYAHLSCAHRCVHQEHDDGPVQRSFC